MIVNEKLEDIKVKLFKKPIFVIPDETTINIIHFTNILIGDLNYPNQTYLVDVLHTRDSVDSSYITRSIDDVVLKLNINRLDFKLLISDAASYMKKAGTMLTSLFPNLIHVTCIVHLFHNVCLLIKNTYVNIDNFIASTKASTIKNRNRRNMFNVIGTPLQPVVTRWGSWSKAAVYYSDNFHDIKEIINSFEGTGLLAEKNKEVVNNNLVLNELLELRGNYNSLINIMDDIEEKKYNIAEIYNLVSSLSFNNDPMVLRFIYLND